MVSAIALRLQINQIQHSMLRVCRGCFINAHEICIHASRPVPTGKVANSLEICRVARGVSRKLWPGQEHAPLVKPARGEFKYAAVRETREENASHLSENSKNFWGRSSRRGLT